MIMPRQLFAWNSHRVSSTIPTAIACRLVLTLCVLFAQCLWAEEPVNQPTLVAEDDDATETVKLYSAMQQGQVFVRVVPTSYAHLTLAVRNTSRQLLRIELPKVFAAVPTERMLIRNQLTQRGISASLSQIGARNSQNSNDSQGLGGSLSGPWSLSGRRQQNRPEQERPEQERPEQEIDPSRYLILGPGQIATKQIATFCLEYGKPDPHQKIPYVLCPLEELNDKPAVSELIELFAQQGLDQYVAQLAAWHVANGTPWQMLTRVQFPRTKNSRGHRVTPAELLAARQLVKALPSYGSSDSLSNQR